MAVTARKLEKPLFGSDKPRLAPPTPARTALAQFLDAASSINVTLIPWQETAARYLYALGRDEEWLYAEVAVIVSRQAGKTTLLKPHVKARLRMGRSILHAAQKRDFVRRMFERDLVPAIRREWPDAVVRLSGGQESVFIPETGGSYQITAATGGGPRGLSVDDLIMDELRELDEDFVEAAKATQAASLNPQTVYLSNAGADDSDALNAVRRRVDEDPALAWLEWSSAPHRSADDVAGWAEANPSLGHFPGQLAFLQRTYQSHKLAGTMPHFETEHLCRWVPTLRERLVEDQAWLSCQDVLTKPLRPAFGVSLDPDHKRGSIAMAWMSGANVCVRLIADVSGDQIDPDALGDQMRKAAVRFGSPQVGYDPLTDAHLAKYAPKGKAKPITGNAYAVASAHFVTKVQSGALKWADADAVTDDLSWTARKPDGPAGSFHAVRAKDDRPVTASLAAIRAVWLASGPTQSSAPRIR